MTTQTSIPVPNERRAPKVEKGTAYVVLRQKGTDVFEVIGEARGANDRAAIKAATAALDAEGRRGTFVAVPRRTFHPRTRAVMTVETESWA